MKWVRCPSCRTVNDVDRYALCDGCNRDLTGMPPEAWPAGPPPALQGELDTRTGNRLLWIVAILLLLGTFALPVGSTMFTALISFILFAILFTTLGVRRVRASRLGALGRALGTLLAVGAGLAGAILLVGIACAFNLRDLRLG